MSNKESSGGTSGASLLAVAFIVLKLCHVIDWSWWWVLSPVWIIAGLVIIIVIIKAMIEVAQEEGK